MKYFAKITSSMFVIIVCAVIIMGAGLSKFSLRDVTKVWAWYTELETNLVEIKADHNALRTNERTRNYSYAGLAINSVNGTYAKTTNACDYCIDNVMYQAAADATLEVGTGTALAANQKCIFLVMANVSGALTTEQGSIVASTETAALPALWAAHAPVGYIQVSTAAAVFTPGTTSLGASNVTDTYVNLSQVNSGSSDTSAISSSVDLDQ